MVEHADTDSLENFLFYVQYIQTKFVFLKISMFWGQVGIMVPSMKHHVYCFPYVIDHNCESIIIRKCNIILRNGCVNSFYITDCWKNVDLLLLIELKGNCDTALILTSETVNYTSSKPATMGI
jgi:hypothetical protein